MHKVYNILRYIPSKVFFPVSSDQHVQIQIFNVFYFIKTIISYILYYSNACRDKIFNDAGRVSVPHPNMHPILQRPVSRMEPVTHHSTISTILPPK